MGWCWLGIHAWFEWEMVGQHYQERFCKICKRKQMASVDWKL